MATRGTRTVKVNKIFHRFDVNQDGGLNRDEMADLVVAVNPRVKFSEEQIKAILDEVFRTYGEFIDGEKGLTLDGLIRTYDDGAGDVDRDFDALGLELKSDTTTTTTATTAISIASEGASSSSIADERVPEPHKKQRTSEWAASPNHGILFDDTWKIVDDLEIVIKRFKSKQAKDGKSKGDNSDAFSDPGWSRELGLGPENSIVWDESRTDYTSFVRELTGLRNRADTSRSREEAFDGHMAIGKVLYDHQLYKEALVSFKRACELQPVDVRPHFRAGNCLYILGNYLESKGEFNLALTAAEASGNQWTCLLPQIHVNFGISLEAEGMILNACEHYREAAILSPTHFRALKLLGSALVGVGEYKAAVKALEEAIFLKNDYADAHCDLASALHAMGDDDNAIKEFQKAIDLKPGHVDALYNLGGLNMDMGRHQRASEMYTRVLAVAPNHWRAQLNKAVSLLGAGENEEAKKSMKEALKMTNRVELHDAILHLKHLQKKKRSSKEEGGSYVVMDPSKFATDGEKTTSRIELASALDIRAFQRITRLDRCSVENLKNELNENVPVSYSGRGAPEKTIRKAPLEEILRRLLVFLKPETFVEAVKAINQKILSVLDDTESGRVDLGMFLAITAPICKGPPETRKRVAFDSLLWRPGNDGSTTHIKKVDALSYIKLLRAIYLPSYSVSEMLEIHGGEADPSSTLLSYSDFVTMFDDGDWGFGIVSCVLRLESGDRKRHGNRVCAVCQYSIIGWRFKEKKTRFSLCSNCYREGKVPIAWSKKDGYVFKEYSGEMEAIKDKCKCLH